MATSSDDEIASLVTETDSLEAATDLGAEEALSADEAALELSQCLRDQGLDVADIAVDADGNINLRSALDNVERGNTGFRDAMDACADILENTSFGGGGRGGDFDEIAMQDAYLEFSDCIREQGFEDIEDLSFQAPGGRGGAGGAGGDEDPPEDGAAPGRGEGQREANFGDANSRFAEALGLDPDDPAVVAALDKCSPLIENAFGRDSADDQSGEG
ncbi:MAG: hypothetical protein O2815_05290 [Actinomycetota bacterium]|nr:hypothetical protein [Actinomycetota bacterium]